MVEMPLRQAHRNLLYDTLWWRHCIARARTSLVPSHVSYVDASTWVHNEALFADPLHSTIWIAARFGQRLGRLLGPKPANLSAHPAAAFETGSSRP